MKGLEENYLNTSKKKKESKEELRSKLFVLQLRGKARESDLKGLKARTTNIKEGTDSVTLLQSVIGLSQRLNLKFRSLRHKEVQITIL